MEQKMINIKNRSAGVVVYTIPEKNIRREFMAGEVKMIPAQEVVELTYQPGGRMLLEDYLQIVNDELLDSLNIRKEPEYFMTEEQIVDLLMNGSLDAFLDCLDFAPSGVLDLVKKFSVSLPLNDMEKRMALKEKTGFDVSAAIAHLAEEKEEEKEEGMEKEVHSSGRRTSVSYRKEEEVKPAAPARRATPNYKIVDNK